MRNAARSSAPLTIGALVVVAILPAQVVRAAAPDFAPGEVLVQFRHGTGNLQRQSALARAHGRVVEQLRTQAMADAGDDELWRVATDMAVPQAVAALKGNPSIALAEPNYRFTHAAVASDPYYANGSEWGVYGDDQPAAAGPSGTTNAFGSMAEKAWASGVTGSRTVYVGIIDEGLQFTHPDLAANVWTNPYDPVDGIDNDGNGYVDDVHGWDFVNRDGSVYDGTDDDHGTHVSGTIGAVGANGAGIAGMNWNVTLISAKFLGPTGGYTSDAVKALDYITNLKVRHGLNIVATNNSWSGGGDSQALRDAIIRAAKQGILTICAAGNSAADNDSTAVYPANYDTRQGTSTQSAATYDGVVSVAAIDRYGALASFSDYGAASVDLGAPGVSILSTVPAGTYAYYSGTSMATPHVTGAVALYAAAHPGALASEIRAALLGSAKPTASLSGRTVTGGRLDVGNGFLGAPAAATHDVAVTAISVPLSVVRGTTATISVVYVNQGTASETFTASLGDAPPAGGTPGTVSAPVSVTLAAGASRTVAFTWGTSTASTGTHVLTGRASVVAGEADTADNARGAGSSVLASAPAVTSILPNAARKGAVLSVTVRGTGFAAGARLTFTNGAGNRPNASNVVVAAGGASLQATVSIPSGTQSFYGHWDVVVTNPNGASGRLVSGFTVSP